MFGEAARGFAISLGTDFKGALLAILPPGAFIGLGLLLSLKNVIDKRLAQRKAAQAVESPPAEAPAAAG